MSLTIPPPGNASRVLRHLRHMEPLPKNAKGGKFAQKQPSYARHTPKFVQPKDRIPYWNIGPGDEVKVNVGGKKVIDEITGEKTKLHYEGIITTIDLERNLVWIRAGENAKDDSRIPKNIKHVGSRIKDPEKGIEGGFTPNTVFQIRPIHYSNLQLKLPVDLKLPKDVESELDLKKGVYASRIKRNNVSYNRQAGHFVWKRYAVVPSAGGALQIEVPWKILDQRDATRSSNASNLLAVDNETWIPWDPSNPVKLLPQLPMTSQESLERLKKAIAQRQEDEKRNQSKLKGSYVIRGKNGNLLKQKKSLIPLLPQPPTASEQIAHTRREIADWLEKAKLKGKIDDQVFSAMNYIDVTPIEGPNDTRWNSLTFSGDKVEKNALSKVASKRQMDSWPIELLMTNDLTNPKGLRNRMRSWHLKQANKQVLEEKSRLEDAKRVNLLREKIDLDQAKEKKRIHRAEVASKAEQACPPTV